MLARSKHDSSTRARISQRLKVNCDLGTNFFHRVGQICQLRWKCALRSATRPDPHQTSMAPNGWGHDIQNSQRREKRYPQNSNPPTLVNT